MLRMRKRCRFGITLKQHGTQYGLKGGILFIQKAVFIVEAVRRHLHISSSVEKCRHVHFFASCCGPGIGSGRQVIVQVVINIDLIIIKTAAPRTRLGQWLPLLRLMIRHGVCVELQRLVRFATFRVEVRTNFPFSSTANTKFQG
jgi:hypothetical protein